MSSANDIEAQAARWLAREDGDGWSGADEVARNAWLDNSIAHRVAYLRLKSAWSRADRLAALRSVPMMDVPAAPRFAHWRQLAAGFAVFSVLGAGAAAYWLQSPPDLYRTPVGAHETVHLADGSIVELNTDTQLRATVNAKERRIVLEQGEAYFQVVHDSARPFVVLVGDRRITDLGTKFSVRRDGDRVAVVVTEGKVRIENLDRRIPPVVVKRDTQVLASADDTLVTAHSSQQIANELGWRNGMLIFDQETLADAAAEFNRYNRKKIVIDGSVIAQTRIGGNFEAANVEVFAWLLHEGFGLKVEETDSEVRISQ